MRLLNVDDLGFHEVPSHGPFPGYAILSHTWIQPSDEEVTYQDLLTLEPASLRQKTGWRKIQHTIDQARDDGLAYAWIDTCCINKLDPTELTEAINCMFNWYSMCAYCYVYLSDVKIPNEAPEDLYRCLYTSKWFKRGWTLQELIAPHSRSIYDEAWNLITTRTDSALLLSDITKVDMKLLEYVNTREGSPHGVGMARLEQYSLAQRMSWAAGRQTSRSEDRAYSLLGLFNIVMPLHYGEGLENAFKRLQQEIIKQSADQSILAWEWPPREIWSNAPESQLPFLAPSPDCFRSRGEAMPSSKRGNSPYAINNVGLEIDAFLVRFKEAESRRNIYFGYQDQLISDQILMRPEPPITPLRRAKPLRFGEEETSRPFVAAILGCTSSVDPSLVYMLPLAPAPMGHYFMTRSLHCEQFDWDSVMSEMEPCFPDSPWQKITVLRAPLRLLQERTIADDRARCVKVNLATGQGLATRLSPILFWPPDDWNKTALTFRPKHGNSFVSAAAITVRCTRSGEKGDTDIFVTIAFSYLSDRLFEIQAQRIHAKPNLEAMEALCQTLRADDSGTQNFRDTVNKAWGTMDKLSATMKRVETPCDAFWNLEIVYVMDLYMYPATLAIRAGK
ncbi:hypothetical protein PRZ48_011083 [Zasmidium cellare]|uniref:Heterokaryon incompatibility domain-containing protein n=1 Tax=Zasmidium cellare TaxID=395010 RepID=A0ABR0EAF3_ZASCE|nr:hypothetical protein PRZ48_011083 [Zasmidium cellare]